MLAAGGSPTTGAWDAEQDRIALRARKDEIERINTHNQPTVRRFLAEVRARQELPLAEVAVPQHHPLGEEAEVDFGTATVLLAGAVPEVQLFIMRLSASGRAYPRKRGAGRSGRGRRCGCGGRSHLVARRLSAPSTGAVAYRSHVARLHVIARGRRAHGQEGGEAPRSLPGRHRRLGSGYRTTGSSRRR